MCLEVENRENDAKEGRTLFVKSIPKGTSNQDFHKLWRKFGKVEYANVVKGKTVGFVKFQDVGSCKKALDSEVKIQDVLLTSQIAIDKSEIKRKEKKFDKDGSYLTSFKNIMETNLKSVFRNSESVF